MSLVYGMTVGQLKELLASMPESFNNRVVVLSKDPEGNGFETLGDVEVGWLNTRYEGQFSGSSPVDDESWEVAESRATHSYTLDEDSLDEDAPPLAIEPEHDHPAICLWP